jgi:hypothetical protein
MAMYVQDNDGVYPPAVKIVKVPGGSVSNRIALWPYYLDPYIHSGVSSDGGAALVDCWNQLQKPDYPTDPPAKYPWHCPDDPGTGLSYSVNPFLCGEYAAWGSDKLVLWSHVQCWQESAKVLSVADPSHEVICADGNRFWDSKKKEYGGVFPDWVRSTDTYLRPFTHAQLIDWYSGYLKQDYTDTKGTCPKKSHRHIITA